MLQGWPPETVPHLYGRPIFQVTEQSSFGLSFPSTVPFDKIGRDPSSSSMGINRFVELDAKKRQLHRTRLVFWQSKAALRSFRGVFSTPSGGRICLEAQRDGLGLQGLAQPLSVWHLRTFGVSEGRTAVTAPDHRSTVLVVFCRSGRKGRTKQHMGVW